MRETPRGSTMVELVAELEKVTPRTPLVDRILAEAKAGEFHDYKNKKYDCGKVAAVGLLREAGLEHLAKKVINGDYDEFADAEDIAHLRSITPRHTWKLFGLEDEDIARAKKETSK